MNGSNGFLYQFWGAHSAKETYFSMLSARAWGGQAKDYPITVMQIVPDDNMSTGIWVEKIKQLNNISYITRDIRSIDPDYKKFRHAHDRAFRQKMLLDMPYEVTFRLDADTLILKDVSKIFRNTAKYGLTGVRDLWKPERWSLRKERIQQLNGGVICFRKDVAHKIGLHMQKLVDDGTSSSFYDADQPILNTSLADLGYHTPERQFPPEWNQPGVKDETVIMHSYSFAHLDAKINRFREDMYTQMDNGAPEPKYVPKAYK